MAISTSIPRYCHPTTPFLGRVSQTFDSCIPTPLALLSTSLGVCSILSWLFAQLPQIWKNYKLKSASGLSMLFLLEWLAGDLTNLLGALFTHQASWQVIVASYYVFVDVALFLQFAYFSYYKTWKNARLHITTIDAEGFSDDSSPSGAHQMGKGQGEDKNLLSKRSPPESTEPSDTGDTIYASPTAGHHTRAVSSEKSQNSCTYHAKSTTRSFPSSMLVSSLFAVAAQAQPLTRVAFSSATSTTSTHSNNLEAAGRILSWISTFCYLASRLPQIYKNHVRKSTTGLSPLLFIAAFFGNLFYSTSIATNPAMWGSYPPYGLHGWIGPDGNDRSNTVALAAPFFLGAAGVLGLDGYIGLQFLMYGEGLERSKVIMVEDERGRSRWQTVSGWMRGWVPSPSPPGEVIEGEAEEDQRPLLERGDSIVEERRRRYGGTSR